MKRGVFGLLVAAALPAMAQQLADGEIRKVDRKAGTVTIKHGPIQSIDKIKFQAEVRAGGIATVTSIEAAK